MVFINKTRKLVQEIKPEDIETVKPKPPAYILQILPSIST